jgi:hypothetical protein
MSCGNDRAFVLFGSAILTHFAATDDDGIMIVETGRKWSFSNRDRKSKTGSDRKRSNG